MSTPEEKKIKVLLETLNALGVAAEIVAPDIDENAFPEPAVAKAEAVAAPKPKPGKK